ncbi:MAG: HEAT repeat domain-containing protein [Armatimonadota bacterium]
MTPSPSVREPDSAPEKQAGLTAIESLARAARQVALYGLEHPIAAAAVESACGKWVDEVGHDGAEISSNQQGLLWNGQPLPADLGPVLRLHEAMRERLIACVRFEPQVSDEDVVELLQLLGRDPQDIIGSGGAMAAFGRAGGGVRIEDVDFSRELRESEAAWIETCGELDEDAVEPLTRIFDCCLRTVRSLGDGRTLDRFRHVTPDADSEDQSTGEGPALTAADQTAATHIAHAVQCAGEIAMMADEGYWEDWQAQMLSLLMELEADRRSAIFRAPTTIAPGRRDVLAMIARRMETEECVSLVMDYPGGIQSEPSRGLARVLVRIMPNGERRAAIEPALHAEATRRGISEDIYRNVVELLLSRIEKAEAETAQRHAWVPDAMATLTHTDREGTGDPGLEALLSSTSPKAVHRARVEMLLELLHADLKVDQCSVILALLSDEVTQCTGSGDQGLAFEILGGLRQAAAADVEHDAGRRAVAAQALARTGSGPVVGMVMSQFPQAHIERKRELVLLLAGLGDEGMLALVMLAQQPHPLAVAETVTAITRQDGSSFYWLRRLLAEANPDAIPEIIRTLVHSGNPRAIAQLSVLAEHESLSVKLELIGAMRNAGVADAAGVLERLLYDPDTAVRIGAVQALGAVKATSAVPALLELMARQAARGDGVRLRAAAMTALGAIGAEAAVPLLREFLLRVPLLSPFASARIRVVAAAALASIGTASARGALELGARSRSRTVRQACERGLGQVRAAAQSPGRSTHAD